MNAAVSIGGLLAWARGRLADACDVAGLEAELLLSFATGQSRSVVMAFPERPVSAEAAAVYRDAVRERLGGRPLAQITGTREFYSLALAVNREVLIPRPETEVLVDAALEHLGGRGGRVLLDLGTGSGAIALAVKQARPDVEVWASDVAAAALETASRNARGLGVNVRFVQSDWFDALEGRRFDVIVCNPPYVRGGDGHFTGSLRFEPRLALDGGEDGFDAFRAILSSAQEHLADDGWLLLEHGFDQRRALTSLAARSGFHVAAARDDLGGRPRLLVLQAEPSCP